jgi:hypothetical protein
MSAQRRVDSEGVVLAYGVRYSWAYVVVILAALALLVIDLIGDLGGWANVAVIVLIVVAVVLRPGGVRGPRHAQRVQEETSERSFPEGP